MGILQRMLSKKGAEKPRNGQMPAFLQNVLDNAKKKEKEESE